jgi:hypothetical protein
MALRGILLFIKLNSISEQGYLKSLEIINPYRFLNR